VTDAPQEEAAKPESNARPPQEMRLRPRRAPVMRLSRRVLVGLGVVAAAGISVALFFALQPQRRTTGPELYNTDNRTTPDGLASLPRNYGELPRSVPQLGPPLPGDLGRPILNAGAPAPAMPMSTSNTEEQRAAQEQEAALTSHLFATTNLPARTSTQWPPRCQPLPRERHRPRHRRRQRRIRFRRTISLPS
jgi:type IV secretion system protein TrbI